MDNTKLFGEDFIKYLLSVLPMSRVVSGGREILCRCKYCPDSDDITHAHMYIHIPQDKDDPAFFNCFKCHTSGIVTSKRLLEWGIYDANFGEYLDLITKNADRKGKLNGYNRIVYPKLSLNEFNTDKAFYKLDYLNSRLGLNLTYSDYANQKVVFNLKDTLLNNHIYKLSRDENIVDQLNDNFVGFLSSDNNYVNLRRICDEGIVYHTIDKRYINYNIHNVKDSTEKFYIMPIDINLNNPERINIHIAEGCFDILSIRFNLRGIDSPDMFVAMCGSGYKGILMYLMYTLKIFYFNLHLYPDNDDMGTDKVINKVLQYIKPLIGTEVYIHRNTKSGEKDFGVPLDRINETCNKLILF